MFNTKRIEALKEEINGLHSYINCLHDRIGKIERKEIPNIISCSTCKCLIRKKDAIKGKSEIVEKNFGRNFSGNETIVEEIQRTYYCLRCKPKK